MKIGETACSEISKLRGPEWPRTVFSVRSRRRHCARDPKVTRCAGVSLCGEGGGWRGAWTRRGGPKSERVTPRPPPAAAVRSARFKNRIVYVWPPPSVASYRATAAPAAVVAARLACLWWTGTLRANVKRTRREYFQHVSASYRFVRVFRDAFPYAGLCAPCRTVVEMKLKTISETVNKDELFKKVKHERLVVGGGGAKKQQKVAVRPRTRASPFVSVSRNR